MDKWAKGTDPKRLHANVRRRILQAREWKRFPPTLAWVKQQPAGLVREVIAASEADDARSARTITHGGDVNKWAGEKD